MHLLVQRTGLTAAIDERLRLLQVHQPYHESDHMLNIAMPCQILRAGRRIVYRLLAWNTWQRVFLRGVEALRLPLRC